MCRQVTYRPAQARDADALAALHVVVWRETYADLAPQEALEKLDEAKRFPAWQGYLASDRVHVFVAEYQGQLCGLVCAGPAGHPAFGKHGEIKHLYVSPQARGQGVGSQLLSDALAYLNEAGYSAASLAVVRENRVAVDFYKSNGGRETGRFYDAGPLWKSDNLVISFEFGGQKMAKTALLIIDVQKAFNERKALGHSRNNPEAEGNIAALLEGFREAIMPVYHIHHASTDPNSLFHPSNPLVAPQAFVTPWEGEAVIVKSVNSSFIGTTLEADLRTDGIERLVICGATTNHCVETTTRMAGNLGFDTWLVRDACWAFDQTGPDGDIHLANDVHQMSLSNLLDEFAEIVRTDEVLRLLPRMAGQ